MREITRGGSSTPRRAQRRKESRVGKSLEEIWKVRVEEVLTAERPVQEKTKCIGGGRSVQWASVPISKSGTVEEGEQRENGKKGKSVDPRRGGGKKCIKT